MVKLLMYVCNLGVMVLQLSGFSNVYLNDMVLSLEALLQISLKAMEWRTENSCLIRFIIQIDMRTTGQSNHRACPALWV